MSLSFARSRDLLEYWNPPRRTNIAVKSELALRLEIYHEFGEARLSCPLHAFCRKDLAHCLQARVDTFIHHNVVIFSPMAHLVGSLLHAAKSHAFRILSTDE